MRLNELPKHAQNVRNSHDAVTFAMMANSAAIEAVNKETMEGRYAEATLKRANKVLSELLSDIETGKVED